MRVAEESRGCETVSKRHVAGSNTASSRTPCGEALGRPPYTFSLRHYTFTDSRSPRDNSWPIHACTRPISARLRV